MPSGSRGAHRLLHAPAPWPEPGESLRLSAAESRHGGRSLRLRSGDELTLVDGDGRAGRARVEGTRAGRLEVRLLGWEDLESSIRPEIELAVPWLRAPARIDWLIEKGTELGMRALRLFAAEQGLKRGAPPPEARQRRWLDLALAAMKQSGRAWCPRLSVHPSLAALLGETEGAGARIAVGDPAGEAPQGVFGEWLAAERWLLVVGPEGGLTAEEMGLLRERGARCVRLGPHRLRSESAAIALCAQAAALIPAPKP